MFASPTKTVAATTSGTVGTSATLNGKAFTTFNPALTSHTFTVPDLGITVPLGGVSPAAKNPCSVAPCTMAESHRTITFKFTSPGKGWYRWRRLVPCALGSYFGDGGPMQILAVTVDPKRDTPPVVRAYLWVRGALGRMAYLLGSVPQLHRTWKNWDVAVSAGPNKLTDGHSSITYGITASGHMAVVYPANFTPEQIMHDVPLLASS